MNVFWLLFCCFRPNHKYILHLLSNGVILRWSASLQDLRRSHYVRTFLGEKDRCGEFQSTDAPLSEITLMHCEETLLKKTFTVATNWGYITGINSLLKICLAPAGVDTTSPILYSHPISRHNFYYAKLCLYLNYLYVQPITRAPIVSLTTCNHYR